MQTSWKFTQNNMAMHAIPIYGVHNLPNSAQNDTASDS